MSVEALEKNVASLTRLLSKASSRAERDDLAEQQAKSKLDSEKAALASSLSKVAKKGAAAKTQAAVKEEGDLEKAFEKATAKATSAQQASHKLKLKLNKQVEALATAQIHEHDAPRKSNGKVFDAGMDPVDHAADPEMAAKAGSGGPLGIAEPRAKMTEGTSELLALHHKLAALTSTLDVSARSLVFGGVWGLGWCVLCLGFRKARCTQAFLTWGQACQSQGLVARHRKARCTCSCSASLRQPENTPTCSLVCTHSMPCFNVPACLDTDVKSRTLDPKP